MASSAAAGLPSLLGARVIRAASSPAAPTRVHLPAAAVAAAPARGIRLRAAICRRRTARVPQLRCAPPGNDDTATAIDGVVEDAAAAADLLPWWAPSIEELIEFENTDLSPKAIGERFVRESKEAKAAVKGAVAGLLLRPLREFVADVRKLKTVYEVEEFHIGLPVGAVMACVALYQLWKAAPSACVDFLLTFAFYRLSVMAADIKRRGYANDMIIRLKLFITVAMLVKSLAEQISFLGYLVSLALFGIYFFSVGFEVRGLKKYGRYILPMLFDSLKTPEGRWACLDTLSEIDFGIDDYDD